MNCSITEATGMKSTLIKNARIVNEGEIYQGSILIRGEKVETIFRGEIPGEVHSGSVIDAGNLYLLPGVIDDQVHFREPGLTTKGDIYTESKAAVAGGITSYMEMPNTVPPAITQKKIQEKFSIAAQKSLSNYSFYLGATNHNMEELLRTDPHAICGIKVFMGSSTGNLLVDDPQSLSEIFAIKGLPIAIHSEDEQTIQDNLRFYREKFGTSLDVSYHPKIRSEEACYKCTSRAIDLAVRHNTRLHILHISTAREIDLLDSLRENERRNITAEVCIHHLWFDDNDYQKKGNFIKWNPSIKGSIDKEKLLDAVLRDSINVIATDHAPHTREEKRRSYLEAPSGGPMVQHALPAMMEFVHRGALSLEKLVEKMCHNPAKIFQVEKRGFIREGYYADLVLLDPNAAWIVSGENILYKCNWSPMEGETFQSSVRMTFVNGNLVYDRGVFNESIMGKALSFER